MIAPAVPSTVVRLRARVSLSGRVAPALTAAGRLARALERLGLPAVVNGDDRVALVSVWRGLTVWVGRMDGFWRFWWDTGRRSGDRHVYATQDVSDPAAAARRVARRFLEVRERWPHADLLAGSDGLWWSL